MMPPCYVMGHNHSQVPRIWGRNWYERHVQVSHLRPWWFKMGTRLSWGSSCCTEPSEDNGVFQIRAQIYKKVCYILGGGRYKQDTNNWRIIKKGAKQGGSKIKCKLIKKRERWVQHLEQQRNATTSKNYQTSDIKHLHQSRYSQSDLQIQIANMITKPNETWLKLKKKEYMTPKTYFGTYS